MTLAAVWLVEERIYAVADTRISRERGNVHTEHGPKILPLQLVCKQPGPSGFFDRVALRTAFGFAYAGATLPGLATHALASTLIGNLAGATGAPLPSLQSIAMATAEIGHRYMREVGELSGTGSLFSGIVFGYCLVTQRFKAFHFQPSIVEQRLTVTVSEFDLYQLEAIIVIGSRPQLLRDRIETDRPNLYAGCENDPRMHALREIDLPVRCLEALIREGADDSFGGAVQFGWGTRQGFEPAARMVPITPTPPSTRNAALTVLGFDMFDFMNVDHYFFSLSGR